MEFDKYGIITEKEVKNLNKWKRVLILLFIFVLLFYFVNFYNTTILSQESSAQFGDYFGGVLNPFLGFATVALLVWSIQIQLRELKFTRDELELNTQANRDQAAALTTQNNILFQNEKDKEQYNAFDKFQKLFIEQQSLLNTLLDKPLGFKINELYITASDLLYKNSDRYQEAFRNHIKEYGSANRNIAKYQIAHTLNQCSWILERMLAELYYPGFVDKLKVNIDWLIPFISICYEKELISQGKATELCNLINQNIRNSDFDEKNKNLLIKQLELHSHRAFKNE